MFLKLQWSCRGVMRSKYYPIWTCSQLIGVGHANSAYRVIELVIMKAGAFATEVCELTYFEPKLFLNYGEK